MGLLGGGGGQSRSVGWWKIDLRWSQDVVRSVCLCDWYVSLPISYLSLSLSLSPRPSLSSLFPPSPPPAPAHPSLSPPSPRSPSLGILSGRVQRAVRDGTPAQAGSPEEEESRDLWDMLVRCQRAGIGAFRAPIVGFKADALWIYEHCSDPGMGIVCIWISPKVVRELRTGSYLSGTI